MLCLVKSTVYRCPKRSLQVFTANAGVTMHLYCAQSTTSFKTLSFCSSARVPRALEQVAEWATAPRRSMFTGSCYSTNYLCAHKRRRVLSCPSLVSGNMRYLRRWWTPYIRLPSEAAGRTHDGMPCNSDSNCGRLRVVAVRLITCRSCCYWCRPCCCVLQLQSIHFRLYEF